MPKTSVREGLGLYIHRQASSVPRYFCEQLIYLLIGWIPTAIGIGIRGIVYRLVMRLDGWVAIESRARFRFGDNIALGHGVYLDENTYLHACAKGISIGEGTYVMYGAVLHVYNFRGIPHSGITIGKQSLIGEYSVIRGQGGVVIGDRVYAAPHVQIMAVNHVFDDPTKPFVEQGITAEGIIIEDDVWLGAGAIVMDGVRIGKGAVVAAGAVVTHDLPEHTLAAGVPAQVIKEISNEENSKRERVVYFTHKEAR